MELLSLHCIFWVVRHIPHWIPGAGFKKFARDIGKKLRNFDRTPFEWAKSQIVSVMSRPVEYINGNWTIIFLLQESGSFRESFVSDHIGNAQFASSQEEREDILRWCAVALYAGGGDTVCFIYSFWSSFLTINRLFR